MPSVVIYFQMHQPYRLRRYSVFDQRPQYFDDASNTEICRKVAEKCYRPGLQMLLDLVRRHRGAFRVAISITGTLLEQLEAGSPDVVALLRELVQTGSCEVLGETYYHSLSSLYSPDEFAMQVAMHTRRMEEVFSVTPRVFRNTELIYSNEVARAIGAMKDANGKPRFTGVLIEGVPNLLGRRSVGKVYSAAGSPLRVLMRSATLSDDIAFRFSDRHWNQWPLTAGKFAKWIAQSPSAGVGSGGAGAGLVNLFMDFETFGEHQWADTGIFQFFDSLPDAVWAADRNAKFISPSEAIAGAGRGAAPGDIFDCPEPISWADEARDLSAWRGNAMQRSALDELYRMELMVKDRARGAQEDDEEGLDALRALADWRRLTTSDHVYYMSTKGAADGSVHSYFRPFESPYEAYISFMNVIEGLRRRVAGPNS